MGSYGNENVKCPNCGKREATEEFNNDMLEDYVLACKDCGLVLYASQRMWIPTKSMVKKDIIGKSQEEIDDIVSGIYRNCGEVDDFVDEQIIKEPF